MFVTAAYYISPAKAVRSVFTYATVVAGDPGITNVPFHHSSDDRAQSFAFFGQRIFEARWMFGVMRGCDDSGLDQPLEPIGKAHQHQICPEIRSAGQ